MPFNLQEFRSNLVGSGSRPNLFQVELQFPASAVDADAARLVTFMAEAASLPVDFIGVIPVHYFGRQLKYPGDRRFQPWAIQVINDENFTIRNAFERWLNSLNMHVANMRSPAAAVPIGYCVDAVVKQYAKIGGDPIKEYTMTGAWPSDVSDISLAWELQDTLEKFMITFQYQWWTSNTTT
jgi:hypothetical protein